MVQDGYIRLDFIELLVIDGGQRVALSIDHTLGQRHVQFRECDDGGCRTQSLIHLHQLDLVGNAHLQLGQVFRLGHGKLVVRQLSEAPFPVGDHYKTLLAGILRQQFSRFAVKSAVGMVIALEQERNHHRPILGRPDLQLTAGNQTKFDSP